MERYAQMKNSGVDWIQDIPTGWGVRVLFQLADQVKNKNKDLAEKNLLSLSYGKIKRKDINNPEGLLPESFDGYNIIEADDIVLRLTDLQNDHTSLRVGQAKERGIITSAYTTLRPSVLVNPQSLYYVIHAYDLIKGFYGMGAGVRQGLNYDEVKTIRVPLPPMEEQKSIVAFLDDQVSQIDSIIEDEKASVEEYTRWKSSLISNAVTKGLNSEVPFKDSGYENLGEIPTKYSVASIRWLLNLLTDYTANGSFGDLAKNVHYKDSPDYARLVRLTDLRVAFENEGVYVDKHAYDYLAKSSLFGGEILLANVGAYAGLAVEMPKVNFLATLGPNMFLIKTDPNKWDQHFAYYSLIGSFSSEQLKQKANNTTAQPKLNKDNLKSVMVVLPPLEEQKQISSFLDSQCEVIDSLIAEKYALIEDLESYKRSLIYETVTGKRKVV